MKKIYFLAVLLSAFLSSFACTTHYYVYEKNWRWRNNDGSETTATWRAPQDSIAIYKGGIIRLRQDIVNASNTNLPYCEFNYHSIPVSLTDSLQYSTDKISWKTVGLSKKKAFIIAGAGGYLKQDEPTTAQLIDNDYVFSQGKVMVTDAVLKNFTIPGNVCGYYYRTELEWSLQGTAKLLADTVYYFRMVDKNGYYYSMQYPPLRTGKRDALTNLYDKDEGNAVIAGQPTATVFPNPTQSAINFQLENKAAKNIQATLINVDGRVLYQQSFENVQAGAINKLDLKQLPPPGIYILKLTGDRLSESIKVVVQ